MAAGKLKENLALISNCSIEQGIFSKKLKIGLIFSIHQAESKSACSNYRPICVLQLFRKIFEKIMYTRLIDFINKNELLFQHQLRF